MLIEKYLLDDLQLSIVELQDILVYLNNQWAYKAKHTTKQKPRLIVNNGKSRSKVK